MPLCFCSAPAESQEEGRPALSTNNPPSLTREDTCHRGQAECYTQPSHSQSQPMLPVLTPEPGGL